MVAESIEFEGKGLENFVLVGTDETMDIRMYPSRGELSFRGVSICNHACSVYVRCLDWLRNYVSAPHPQTRVLFALRYYNTSTSMVILEIFHILENIHRRGGDISVEWQFREGDLDMEDAGAEFAENTLLPFHLKILPR